MTCHVILYAPCRTDEQGIGFSVEIHWQDSKGSQTGRGEQISGTSTMGTPVDGWMLEAVTIGDENAKCVCGGEDPITERECGTA